ncbi:MAG: ABC transporter permease [Gemmatimonadales bacterium]
MTAAIAWRGIRRHRPAAVSLGVVMLLGAACFLAPFIAPYPMDAIDLASLRQPPSAAHLLGTDDLGRDVLSRLLWGGRISIVIGLLAALLGTALGALVGSVAAFFGGRTDNVLMRITDVAYAIPTLPLLIVLSAYAGATVGPMVIIISLLSWMATARVVRGEVLSVRERPFVEAARCLGARSSRLIARHVIPNAVGPLIVGATLAVGNAIMVESSLSFLGLGVQPPTPTWGNMLMDSQATMATKPWLTIVPGTAILLVVLAFNFLGDALADALDPVLRDR